MGGAHYKVGARRAPTYWAPLIHEPGRSPGSYRWAGGPPILWAPGPRGARGPEGGSGRRPDPQPGAQRAPAPQGRSPLGGPGPEAPDPEGPRSGPFWAAEGGPENESRRCSSQNFNPTRPLKTDPLIPHFLARIFKRGARSAPLIWVPEGPTLIWGPAPPGPTCKGPGLRPGPLDGPAKRARIQKRPFLGPAPPDPKTNCQFSLKF